MRLQRARPQRTLISLVSMVDVLMIMLVFFMVTSTYLDLDMMPMAERSDDAASDAPPRGAGAGVPASPLLIRLGADGVPHVQGRAVTGAELSALLSARLAQDPAAEIVVLPSGGAPTQALVTLMDLATTAGSTRLRILRLEARP